MSWVRYSQKKLSDEVINSLTVTVEGKTKFIKDVIHYKWDLAQIKGNPEEVVRLKLYLNKKANANLPIDGNFDKQTSDAIDAFIKNKSREGELADFQVRYPAFARLARKFPERLHEFKKRALLYNELSKHLNIGTSFKSVNERQNIETVQKALAENPDTKAFQTLKVRTSIEGWNSAGSVNYVVFGTDEVSYAEYITRLTNKHGVVGEITGSNLPKKEVNETVKAMLERARIFMDSLLDRQPSLNMDHGKQIERIYAQIASGDAGCLDHINKLTKDHLKLTVAFNSQEALAIGLRAI